MPPKPKFTKQEIAELAFEIVKEKGVSALTARELGNRMGCSVTPIFSFFRNMEEVKLAAREIALREFEDFVNDYEGYVPALKRVGMQIVAFGMNQPELFRLLFMQEHSETSRFKNTMEDMGSVGELAVTIAMRDYDLCREDAELLFEQLWAHMYGIIAMHIYKVCSLSQEDLGRRMGVMFGSHIMLIKSGKHKLINVVPEKSSDGTYRGRPVSDVPFVE